MNVDSKEFDLKINNNGSYSVYINDKLWLQNGPTFFNGYGETWSTDSSKYPLVLSNVSYSSKPGLKKWHETQFTYHLGNTTTSVEVAIRLYNGDGYTYKVLFTQVPKHFSAFIVVFNLIFGHLNFTTLQLVLVLCCGRKTSSRTLP